MSTPTITREGTPGPLKTTGIRSIYNLWLSKRAIGPASRVSNFDWLRLYLAFVVMYMHLSAFIAGHSVNVRLPLTPVPTFLAISGFMVLRSLLRSSSIKEFWRRRGLRILPAFAVSLALVTVLFGSRGLAQALVTYSTLGLRKECNVPLWSLSMEEVFYSCMCLLFLVGFYKRPILSLVTLIAYFIFLRAYLPINQYTMLPAGFLIGNCWLHYAKPVPTPLAYTALTLYVLNCYRPLLPGFAFPFTQAFGMIAAFAVCSYGKQLPKLPFDISYGLYIYHYPIILWLHLHNVHGWTLWLLGITLPASFALLSYYAVERPCLRLKSKTTNHAVEPLSNHGRALADQPQ